MTRAKKIFLWIAGVFAALVLVLVLTLLLFDWNTLKHPIERMASAASGREVRIEGPLQVHIWSLTPSAVINGLRIGNPPWEVQRPMVSVERVEVNLKLLPLLKGDVVVPRLALIKPDVYLHQDKAGKANWSFESKAPTNAPASKPSKIPALQDLLIENGKLELYDDMRHLKVNGTIQARDQKTQADPTPFKIQANGTINEQRFEFKVAGGPLIHLDPEHPYPFNLSIQAGDLKVQSDGRVLKPFDLGKLDFEVTVSGKDLAEGFYLTQLALPNTAPFNLHAHIARDGLRIKVTDIRGKVGESDLKGTLDIDATRKRPYMQGDLISDQLRLKDLAASLGADSKGGNSLDAKAEAATAAKTPKAAAPAPAKHLFPDAHLQVARVRAMDADVKFSAKAIDAGSLPMKKVSFHLKLDNGVLAIDPFAFDLPQGQIAGQAQIDARKDLPHVKMDVRLKDIQLGQLKPKKPDSSAPLEGVMQARFVVEGDGDSIHSLAAVANGKLTAIVPSGEITAGFAQLTSIDVAKGLGLLLAKGDQKAAVRCAVIQYSLTDGVMSTDNVTVDTQNVLITGSGGANLGPEELFLQIKGAPKKFTFTRLRTPIKIGGHLADPKFGVDIASTLKQGAVAAALGTLATPAAAILAFVDPGLAKDQNCAGMITEASGHEHDNASPVQKPKHPRP